MIDKTALLKKFVAKDNHWKLELLNAWKQESFGGQSGVTIEVILDKTLVLGVAHPAIAQQLLMNSAQILRKIAAICPEHKIERLAFRTTLKAGKAAKKNEIETQEIEQERQMSVWDRSQFRWNNLFLSKKELQSLDMICCQRLKQSMQMFYARCKYKEMINAQNKQCFGVGRRDPAVDAMERQVSLVGCYQF